MLETATTRKAFPMLMMLFILTVSVLGFAGSAAAQPAEEVSATNFICENEDAQFVQFLETGMALFFFGAFALSVIAFVLDKLNDAAGDDFDDVIPWDGDDGAVQAAFMLPVGVWLITFMGNVLFGYNLSCIIPLQ